MSLTHIRTVDLAYHRGPWLGYLMHLVMWTWSRQPAYVQTEH